MKIGIWLEISHTLDLRYDGIGRHMAILISDAIRHGHQVIIAVGASGLPNVELYLKEYQILGHENLTLVSSISSTSIFQRILLHFLPKQKSPIKQTKEEQRHSRDFAKKFQRWLINKCFHLFYSNITLILLTPIIFTLLLIATFAIPLKKIGGFFAGKLYSRIKKILLRLKDNLTIGYYKIISYSASIERSRLIYKIKKSNNLVDLWYIPYPAWDSIAELNHPRVVSLPDLVFLEFPATTPTAFGAELAYQVTKRIENNVKHAGAVISHCNYVKEKHVIERLGVDKKRAFSVYHGSMSVHQPIEALMQKYHCEQETATIYALQAYFNKRAKDLNHSDYLTKALARYFDGLNAANVDYLFVATQVRPYKNIITVCKALHILNTQYSQNLKVFVSGEMVTNPHIMNYIHQHGLYFDCISTTKLNHTEHAAFYAGAKLAIAPSLFEGGFPFIFHEALSVNTPTIMSRVPMTTELLSEEEIQKYTFDPLCPEALASHINHVLNNRDQYLQKQLQTHQRLMQRDWNTATSEYLAIFERVVHGDLKQLNAN